MCISPLVVPARVASFLAAPPRQRSAMAGRSLTRQARAGLPWARALPPSRMLLAAFGERGRPGYRRCGRPRRRRCRISRDRLAAPSFRARAAEASGGAAQALQPYLAMSLSTEHPDEPLDCSLPQYAFCRGEKQLLRICMHSATSAGAALALQGCATGLLALANLCSDDPGEAVSEAINAAHKLVAATFVAGASHSFDRILFIEGCDIGHLMQGVGRRGLTSLFQNLSLLAWAVTLADALTLAAPWIEASPVFTFVSERVSHEAAHTLLGAEKLLARLIR